MNDPGITKERYLEVAPKFGFTKREGVITIQGA